MSNGYPCPNPTCSHVFPAAAIKGTGSLACPRCSTVFQFRLAPATPGKPAAPPASVPPAKPVAVAAVRPAARPTPPSAPARPTPPPLPPRPPVPVAAPPTPPPVPAAQPPAAPAPAPAALPLGDDSPGEDVFAVSAGVGVSMRTRRTRRPRPWWKTIVASVAGLAVLAGVAFLIVKSVQWFREQPGQERGGPALTSQEFNFRLSLPLKPWASDTSLLAPLSAKMAMRRADPPAAMTLAFKDYGTHQPRKNEVFQDAVRRLGNYFKNFEWEQTEDTQLGGQPAQRLIFTGEVNQIIMSGECYVLIYKGIAYWFTTWAPAESVDQVQGEFSDLHKGFTLLKERSGWTERQPPMETVKGNRAVYWLAYNKEVWKEWAQPQDEDPRADLLLQDIPSETTGGPVPMTSAEGKGKATVMVLVLDSQAGVQPVTAARTYLLQQQKKLYPATVIEEFSSTPGAAKSAPKQVTFGLKVPGKVVSLVVKNAESRKRFVVLAVVPLSDQVLVVECDCDLKYRQSWEDEFSQVLSHFSLKSP